MSLRIARQLRWLLLLLIPVLPASGQEADSRFLQSAIEVANWLESVAIVDGDEAYWPTVPDESKETVEPLYSGNAGVVLFFLELYRVTEDARYLDWANKGANHLAAVARQRTLESDHGLFTGLAGLAWILAQAGQATGDTTYLNGSEKLLDLVAKAAQRGEYLGYRTVRWNDITDLVSGSAGIGVVLLDAWRRTGRQEYLDLAIAAGDGLLAAAIALESDDKPALKWLMSPDFPREMPNYSHGTAGICDFLLMLDHECREVSAKQADYDGRFLSAAGKGARYLVSLSAASPSGLIPHHFPDGADLYYLGWCHGPAGTIRFFERLSSTTADEELARLGAEFKIKLLHQIIGSALPERSGGFWNNVSLCCGNAGVIGMLLDYAKPGDNASEMAHRLADDLLARASRVDLGDGRFGLKWKQAEHRSRPEQEQAKTGLMQGSAGIGLMLLKLDATSRGEKTEAILPVLPF
jgi:lantibiotic modifying enzyme